jgi:hypothetical protein
MTVGTLVSAKALLKRWQWEENNIFAAIMLDWDDVQAVATRAATLGAETGRAEIALEGLLRHYKEHGATHLSIPELTLGRLLARGELSLAQGATPGRVYLRAQDERLAELVATELQARLPQLKTKRTEAKNPLISFSGDLPTVAEVGLGFDPAHAELAHTVGLAPVARPVGYSWVQPEMIERTMDQIASLGVRIVAVQGYMTPGFEFNMNSTVEAMRRHHLTYAYFSLSRHQRGDWFLAKDLAGDGLVILAHEFEPQELLEEDWHTVSDRWANLAIEAGIRLCSVRFFRVIHAADPLESLAYIETLAETLKRAGFVAGPAGAVDLTPFQPQRDAAALTGVGLSVAGAAGLAADLLPIPTELKLLGLGATALGLAGLPFWEQTSLAQAHPHHDHAHSHEHHHHDDDDHDHDHHNHDHDHDHHHHDHDHTHHHDHHEHSHDRLRNTAYAPKGLALAAAVAYPAAAIAIDGAAPAVALSRAALIGAAGATALSATAAESDYILGVEVYRGYNLDWLLPLGLAAAMSLTGKQRSLWSWLPLLGVALTALKSLGGDLKQDMLATFDREHRHAHTHHLSAFQRALGDSKMALSLKPLRKWSLLAPLGLVCAALFKRNNQNEIAAVALTAAAAGQVALMSGFRNGQRPLINTAEGRAKSWAIGAILAGAIWFVVWLSGKLGGHQ